MTVSPTERRLAVAVAVCAVSLAFLRPNVEAAALVLLSAFLLWAVRE